jgi:ornithine cyclodeaminase
MEATRMLAPLLFLCREDVLAAGGGSSDLFIDAVTEALLLHARHDVVQPLKPYLRWRTNGHIADRIIAMPAYLGGVRPVAGIKWIGSKHDNPPRLGLERASALIVLNDPETHYPVAIMEGGLISANRTAALTTIAIDRLARPGFSSLSCIGCGPIGSTHVVMALDQFPQITTVYLFDLDSDAAYSLRTKLLALRPRVEVLVAAGPREAVQSGDVIVTCTVASEPWVSFEWLRPGALLCNVSIMDAGKDVFLGADKVIVDDWDQCNREGKILHQLTQEGVFSRKDLHAELSEVVAGMRPGREADSEIIVLNPMGMALLDIACATAIYERALEAGKGTWLSLF